MHERLFLPITPDIVLFLKRYPLSKEHKREDILELFSDYWGQLKTIPSVIKHDRVFLVGNSPTQCRCILQVLES